MTRGGNQLAHAVRMPDGHLQGDTASHAVADDVGLLDAEVLHQRSDVIRHLLVLQGAVDVGGAAMALQIDSDDSPTLGQFRQQSLLHAGRHVCAVDQDDRHDATVVDLVVHLEVIGRGYPLRGVVSLASVAGVAVPESFCASPPPASGTEAPLAATRATNVRLVIFRLL